MLDAATIRRAFEALNEELKTRQPSEVFEIISRYYPHQQVPPKTQFFVEELFQGSSPS